MLLPVFGYQNSWTPCKSRYTDRLDDNSNSEIEIGIGIEIVHSEPAN
jgi:hypothetical protein